MGIYFEEIGKFILSYKDLVSQYNQKQEEYANLILHTSKTKTKPGTKLVVSMEADLQNEIEKIKVKLEDLKVAIRPFIPLLQQNRREIILKAKQIEPQLPVLNKLEEQNAAIINSLRARQKNLDETRAEVVAMCTSKEFKRNFEKLQDKRTYLGLLHKEEILQEIEEFVTGKVANVSTISKSK